MKSFSDRDERPIVEEMDVPPDPSRSWARSLWLHVGLLALVLVALIPVVGSTGIYSVDEGAALAQATQLRTTGHWSLPNDFPAADPRGTAYVLDKSTHTPAGFAPLTKHPAYPRLLALADRAGGRMGIVLVGVLATVVAAALAALIARCIHEDLTVPALWVAGIGSPLLFDSYVVIAHTLGAAGAGLAALGVLRHRRNPHWTALVMVAVGSALAIAMRAEGLLFGLALGAAAGLLALWRARGSVRDAVRASTPAVVAVVASAVAFLVDRQATLPHLVGVLPSTQDPTPSYGLVAGRVSAFVTTWLEPSYGRGLGFLLPAALAVVTLVVVLEVRRHPGDGGLLRAGVVAITVAALAWIVLSPTTVVPGLLCAFPLLIAGLAAWRRSLFRNDDIVLLAGTVALFAAAVLATEYPQGGGAEWGARYLALAVPLAVPLVLEPLRRLRRRVPEANRRVATFALVPLVLAPAFGSVAALRSAHQARNQIIGQVVAAGHATDPGDGGKPVVVTDVVPFGRFAWDRLGSARWLAAKGPELDRVTSRLDDLGIHEFLLVTLAGRDHQVGPYRLGTCRRLGPSSSPWRGCVATRT